MITLNKSHFQYQIAGIKMVDMSKTIVAKVSLLGGNYYYRLQYEQHDRDMMKNGSY